MTDESVEAVCALCGSRRYHTEVFGWQCPYCVRNSLPGQSAAAQVAELREVVTEVAARTRPSPDHVAAALADVRTSSRYAYAHGNAGVLATEVEWLRVHVAELVEAVRAHLDAEDTDINTSTCEQLEDAFKRFSAA